MVNLYYRKSDKKMVDISTEVKDFNFIEITEEDKNLIKKNRKAGIDCFVDTVDNSYYFRDLKNEFCECKGLEEVKKIRDVLLEEQTFYHMPIYQKKLLDYDNIVVDVDVLDAYYLRLHLIEIKYNECSDKESFIIIEVDEYSETEDETIFEYVKPSFIK